MMLSTNAPGRFPLRLLMAAACSAGLLGLMTPDADAQRRNQNDAQSEEEAAADRTFSAEIGEIVLRAQELQSNDQWGESITQLDRALGRSGINNYERAIALQLRGRAYYETERLDSAIRDWRDAIATGILNTDETVGLRINIGQLLIANERYNEGIDEIQAAARAGGEINERLAMMLAQAYAQADRFPEGLRYAEQAYNGANPKERRHFNLVLYYYQSLDRTADQMRIIGEMAARWPTEKNIWTSYASLLAQNDREEDAFEVNKIMYINGMLTEGREIERLAQYYSFYDLPYRGASILEREMNAGRVERTQSNVELLANMWRQAREWDRAIPVLRTLAEMTNAGENYLKLGEALYQQGELQAATSAIESALNRGGLRQTGNAWVLLGNIRYEPGERQSAIEAFDRGAQFGESRRTAEGWARFVREEIRFEQERPRILEQLRRDSCRFSVEDQRETSVLLGNVDPETGRLILDLPEECSPYYNRFGDPLGDQAEQDPAAASAAAAEEDRENQEG